MGQINDKAKCGAPQSQVCQPSQEVKHASHALQLQGRTDSELTVRIGRNSLRNYARRSRSMTGCQWEQIANTRSTCLRNDLAGGSHKLARNSWFVRSKSLGFTGIKCLQNMCHVCHGQLKPEFRELIMSHWNVHLHTLVPVATLAIVFEVILLVLRTAIRRLKFWNVANSTLPSWRRGY